MDTPSGPAPDEPAPGEPDASSAHGPPGSFDGSTPAEHAAAREAALPVVRLDDRLQAIMATSTECPSGRAFYWSFDGAASFVLEVPHEPGMYHLHLYGTPDGVYISHGSSQDGFEGTEHLSVNDLADLVRADPNWHGEDIRVAASYAGQRPDGFGAQLAQELGVRVYVPGDSLVIEPDGTMYVTAVWIQGDDTRPSPALPPSGSWVAFDPSARGVR